MKSELYTYLLSQGSGTLTIENIIINMVVAAILGMLIFATYKATHSGVVYSARFNISLVMTVLVTTTVMCVIGNNITLSLGMVGALSIVRFRTAIKDPRDTIYIFWAVAVGVCCGVSNYMIALIGTVFIVMFLVIFGFVRDVNRMLIIVRGSSSAISEVSELIDSFLNHKGVRRVYNFDVEGNGEIIYEVNERYLKKCEKKNGNIGEKITSISGVKNASILCQEDEITG